MALRRTPYQRRTAYKTGRVFQVGPTATKYLLLVLVAIFTLFYLAQTTQSANKVVEIRALDNKKEELNKQYSALEVEASRQQSLQNLTDQAGQLKMVPNENNSANISVNSTEQPIGQ